MPKQARPFDEEAALAMLRSGASVRTVRRAFGVRLSRILELARRGGALRGPGPRARPFDEARALALLRSGAPAHKVRLEVGAGSIRLVVRLAREHGVAVRRKRTREELRRQDRVVGDLRSRGWSWERVAERLGYGRHSGWRQLCGRRSGEAAGIRMDARTRRAIMARLRSLNPDCGWDDVRSLVRLAGDPSRRWLMTPGEIDIARRFHLLPGAKARVTSK